jgi:flagellar hook protein FlgE
MSFTLSAGVTGLQAHQKMLDIAGNNLANVNTTAFKASRITFSELLSETIKKASRGSVVHIPSKWAAVLGYRVFLPI